MSHQNDHRPAAEPICPCCGWRLERKLDEVLSFLAGIARENAAIQAEQIRQGELLDQIVVLVTPKPPPVVGIGAEPGPATDR